MMNSNDLNVWYKNDLVGRIWQDSHGLIGFCYADDWIKKGFAISQQLPLRKEEYAPSSSKAHQFFVNLLPEGDARLHIVRDLKISNSDFGLLKAIGGECAGALSMLPLDITPSETAQYKQLSETDLKKLVLRQGQIFTFTSFEQRPRLSLAGAHDKCPIFYDGKNYFLPENSSPSTHILKFSISDYRNLPAYEYFLTKLAESIGLPVVQITLKKIEKNYFILVKRYDRILSDNNNIARLHQEDFCQALGYSYKNKYQQEGGPSFLACYNLIQDISINPIQDSENLLRWQVFNVLAGNSDGHAKNLSLLYNENFQTELAPFYDLVCTRAIERIDTKLALSVGGEFDPDKISLLHWEQMANNCNIRFSYLKEMIEEIAQRLLDNLKKTREDFEQAIGAYSALQRVEKVITKLCSRFLKQLKN